MFGLSGYLCLLNLINKALKQILYMPVAVIVALAIAATSGCKDMPRWRDAHGSTWNTLYSVTYMSDRDLHDSIVATLHRVEMSVSPFAAGSVISRINNNATDTVDAAFRDLFDMSAMICGESGGMFDPTMAPIVNLWGFGYDKPEGAPRQAQIDSALSLVGIGGCHIGSDGVLRKKDKGTQFNFSAIAKGYGCDAIGAMLERNGCHDYMVEIGGEIALKGYNPRHEQWRIMIDAPEECDTAVNHNRLAVVCVSDCGIATSGDYRNYRVDSGRRVAHTISPVTGYPVSLADADTVTLSASVIARTAAEADGLATACMLMNPVAATAMVESVPGRAVMLVVKLKGREGYEVMPSASFPKLHR